VASIHDFVLEKEGVKYTLVEPIQNATFLRDEVGIDPKATISREALTQGQVKKIQEATKGSPSIYNKLCGVDIILNDHIIQEKKP